jgi:RHH-type proline utilization regulon transcriptional repressor/proline dehydrogenase/delta 1-pyrroline-5-carboxylate dehydrogenase
MSDSLQNRVEEIAREIGEIGANENAHVFAMSWWSEHTLEWAMAHPDFKTQLFRFVDVFPATRGTNDVVRHMNEYFSGATIPRFVDMGVELADASVVGRPIAAGIAKNNIERMAHQFIAGENVRDAEKNLRALWDAGSGCILDLLGEKTVTESEAQKYADRVVTMINDIAAVSSKWPEQERLSVDDLGTVPSVQVSVKPSALSAHYSPLTRAIAIDEIVAKLLPIFDLAAQKNVLVWLDVEQYDGKDITHDVFRAILEEPSLKNAHLGIVVQAYLKDSFKDLKEIVALSSQRSMPLNVRLVKGAYWDAETITARANDWPTPVWQQKAMSDANYERCVRFLHDHHGKVRAAFASHNIRSLAYAIAYAREHRVPDNGYEIQMLYGMAEPMHAGVRGLGVRHRVYSPIGELVPGMAYLVRRLLENTSNESFVRMRFAEDRSLDDLTAEPKANLQDDRDPATQKTETDASFPAAYDPEPLAEWRSAQVRDEFQRAVDSFTSARHVYISALIDGNEIRTDDTIISVDPTYPERIVAESASCSISHADGAIASAQSAFPEWSKTPARKRATVLFKAAQWLRARRNEIAALEILEAGKPWTEADADVCEAIDFLEYYGRECIRLDSGGIVQSPPGETNSLTYQARGIVVVISPWNFPLAIPTGQVSAALAAGNCVVFKPAEQTPAIASKLIEALLSAGLPKGALAFLPGIGEELGAYLVSHPDVSVIAFTGSLNVGLGIIESASKQQNGQHQVKRVIAEMGGKNPMIVDSDADLDQVIPAVLQSAFGFAGQKCSALSRLIVVGSAFEPVIDRLRGAVQELIVGDPRNMATQVGPVIDQEAFDRLRNLQDNLPKQSEVIARFSGLPKEGYFISPTVVVPNSQDVAVAKNELFGPILSVFRARDFNEAISIANNTDYALTAGCISRSPEHIARASQELRAGNIYVNRGITGAIVGRHPFGGFGLSGVGSKAGGPEYLLQFMDPRSVSENTMRQGFAPE